MYHPDINLAQACRAYFILATSAAVGINSIPSLRKPFILYGARSTPAAAAPPTRRPQPPHPANTLLDFWTRLRVPHAWFLHFYLLSITSSLFWAWQILARGAVFRFVVLHFAWSRMASMTANQVLVSWLFLMLHACRRLYECVALGGASRATMPLVAYVVAGLAFYAVVGIAVWVEGIPVLVGPGITWESIVFSAPSWKTFVAVPLFVLASGVQHDCHVYLSGLEKYTLPSHHLFRHVICPHYAAECAIYIALAIAGAPEGMMLNRTLFTALVFSAANLGVTADSTMVWYEQKFGKEAVRNKWRMMPWVY